MVLGLTAALLVAACVEDRPLAGGASGIENPAVVLSFKDPNDPLAVTGSLRIYDERSDFNDSSLFERRLNGQDTALLTPRDFESLPPGAFSGDSLSADSTLGFNVIVSSGNGQEGMVARLRLRKKGLVFAFEKAPMESGEPRPAGDPAHGSGGDALTVEVLLRPLLTLFTGHIAPEHAGKSIDVVFVPGSPYVAPVDSKGKVLFPVISQGTFPVMAASFLDSGSVFTLYCTTDSLDTGTRPFTLGNWEPCFK